MNKKLVIWGASGHASVVVDIIRLNNEYEIFGLLDDINLDRKNTKFCGIPILGGRDQLDVLLDLGIEHMIVAFGNCEARLRSADLIIEKGFKLISAIHPSAIIASDVHIGEGTVVAADAVINPGSQINRNVIINTSSSVDHDCLIEDGVHVCPGVHLAGHVTIRRGSWIGIGSTVIERIQIGSGVYIGAGSVVLENIDDNTVAYGVPARPQREARFFN